MDINLTLFGESLTFLVLIFVTLKYIWPPLIKAMRERQEKISLGLAATDRAQNDLQIAQQNAVSIMKEARKKSAEFTKEAERKANEIVEASRLVANRERTKLMALTREDLKREEVLAEMELQTRLVDLVNSAVKKVLQNKITAGVDRALIDQFITDIERGD